MRNARGARSVLEGEARRVTDAETLETVIEVYRAGGWPATVGGDAFGAPFRAPSAGPPPWHLHRLTVHTAFGVAGAEPYGATRWRFAAEALRRPTGRPGRTCTWQSGPSSRSRSRASCS